MRMKKPPPTCTHDKDLSVVIRPHDSILPGPELQGVFRNPPNPFSAPRLHRLALFNSRSVISSRRTSYRNINCDSPCTIIMRCCRRASTISATGSRSGGRLSRSPARSAASSESSAMKVPDRPTPAEQWITRGLSGGSRSSVTAAGLVGWTAAVPVVKV